MSFFSSSGAVKVKLPFGTKTSVSIDGWRVKTGIPVKFIDGVRQVMVTRLTYTSKGPGIINITKDVNTLNTIKLAESYSLHMAARGNTENHPIDSPAVIEKNEIFISKRSYDNNKLPCSTFMIVGYGYQKPPIIYIYLPSSGEVGKISSCTMMRYKNGGRGIMKPVSLTTAGNTGYGYVFCLK